MVCSSSGDVDTGDAGCEEKKLFRGRMFGDSSNQVRNKPAPSLFQPPGRCHPDRRYDGAVEPAGGADLLRSHQQRLQRHVPARPQQTDA